MKAEEEKEFAKKCEAAAELVFSRKKEVFMLFAFYLLPEKRKNVA